MTTERHLLQGELSTAEDKQKCIQTFRQSVKQGRSVCVCVCVSECTCHKMYVALPRSDKAPPAAESTTGRRTIQQSPQQCIETVEKLIQA